MGKNDVKKKKSFLTLTCVLYEFRIVCTKLGNKCDCLQLLISVFPLGLATVKKQKMDSSPSYSSILYKTWELKLNWGTKRFECRGSPYLVAWFNLLFITHGGVWNVIYILIYIIILLLVFKEYCLLHWCGELVLAGSKHPHSHLLTHLQW